MPKQNRPLVRDGRIQARKKRTDRSYLGGAPSPVPAPAPEPAAAEEAADAADLVRAAVDVVAPAPAPSAPASSSPAPGRLPTTVRAMQQQGVRKRREVNIRELARRDSAYALHELRRIFILAVMVVVTLLVLTYFLR